MSISGLIKWIRIKSSLIYLCIDCERKYKMEFNKKAKENEKEEKKTKNA